MEPSKFVVYLDRTLPEDFLIAITGAKEGKRQRMIWGLDEYETEFDKVEVRIDPKYSLMSMSFIEGMFSKSVAKLGRQGFVEKYDFICDQHIKDSISSELMFMDDEYFTYEKR